MGDHKEILIGQRFGTLVVTRLSEVPEQNYIMCECQCDCGNVVTVSDKYLKSSNSVSCGCTWQIPGLTYVRNFVGQCFGRLTTIRPTEMRKNKRVVWECQCDCGNTTYVATDNLSLGRTSSCGCLQKERVAKTQTIDISGQRFGRLVALRSTEQRKGTCIVWECRCDCGNTVYATSSELRYSKVLSCGCLPKEHVYGNPRQLKGQRFGKLTVVSQTELRKHGYIVWECKCDCGNTVNVSSRYLIGGINQSCGCTKMHNR